MLKHLFSLTPIETGPWWHARHCVEAKMKEMGVRPGDIVCRLGNSMIYRLRAENRYGEAGHDGGSVATRIMSPCDSGCMLRAN